MVIDSHKPDKNHTHLKRFLEETAIQPAGKVCAGLVPWHNAPQHSLGRHSHWGIMKFGKTNG